MIETRENAAMGGIETRAKTLASMTRAETVLRLAGERCRGCKQTCRTVRSVGGELVVLCGACWARVNT
jgi:hypothetical protein